MLLNKIPCLDKGYVALIDSCNTTQKLREIGQEFYGGEYPTTLEDLGHMTLVFKCPLFVQLALSKFTFKVIDANTHANPSLVDTFIPTAAAVRATDVVTSEAIADDISRTAAALLINPNAYQADGCDRFISQLLTPINVYTVLIVSGSYSEWCKFGYQERFPGPIRSYAEAVRQIIEAEWK